MRDDLIYKPHPYNQFTDDEDIAAFFTAFYKIARQTISWMAEHPFAFYVGPQLTGGFLNYCTYCLYGQFRYKISYVQVQHYTGSINEEEINIKSIDEETITKTYLGTSISDDLHKRITTWNFYKGDGLNFTIPWLKRRVMRFLTGDNGHTGKFNNCVPVSVGVNAHEVTITISPGNWDSNLVDILSKIINNGILNMPPMFLFTVVKGS
ncbi:hypothetical protein PT277_05140 [Acetobacteraceae bacterium ESL0709]|nr:hypothetical protein [Acetobacteraceae bacterium ESL0697]MDF7678080.1 hypothetical protein [Acetobacteraceae bacterium ESL0709]